MDYRKKLIIRELYQSDILNIKTGYYKTERIFPITPKPTETSIKYLILNNKKNISKLTLSNDLLNNSYNKTVRIKRQNSEVHTFGKYFSKIIKNNCLDEKGNYSAKKRFKLEFFGEKGVNNIFNNQTNDKKANKSIKDKRKICLRKNENFSLNKLNKKSNTKYRNYKRIKSCKNIYKNELNNEASDESDNIYEKKLEFTPYKNEENKKINIDHFHNSKNESKKNSNHLKFVGSGIKQKHKESSEENNLNIKTFPRKSKIKYNIINNKEYLKMMIFI